MTFAKRLSRQIPLAFAWALLVPGPAGGQSAQTFDAANLIVTIKGQIGESPTFGAGIIFRREKDAFYVVTANHVVRRGKVEAAGLQVNLKSSPDVALKAVPLPQYDAALDVAVIRVEGLAANRIDVCALRLDRLSASAAKRGDDAFAVGNPHNRGWIVPVRPDKVSEIQGDKIVFESAVIALGHSGGGLLNGDGELIGMLQGDEPPYGDALDIRKVVATLKQWDFPVHLRIHAILRPASAAEPAITGPGDTLGRDDSNPGGRIFPEDKVLVPAIPAMAAVFDNRPPLIGVSENLDLQDARDLLGQACTDVNAKDEDGYTALHEALGWSSARSSRRKALPEFVRLLLDAGADPNAKSGYGATPLSLAARNGGAGVVDLLLTRGAKIDSENSNAVLSAAAAGGALDVIKLLVAKGADVKALDARGESTLYHAVQADPGEIVSPSQGVRAGVSIVEFLIGAGATVDARCISKAIQGRNEPALGALLAARGDVDLSSMNAGLSNFFNPRPEDRRMALMLLSAGAKPRPGPEGLSLLLEAVKLGWPDVAAALVKAGVDLDGESSERSEGGSPLQQAISHHQPEIARMLLEAGANPNIPGPPYASGGYGSSFAPLCMVLVKDEPPDLNLAALLIAHGANVNVVDSNGDSILDTAIRQDRPGVVQLLVKAGARRAIRPK